MQHSMPGNEMPDKLSLHLAYISPTFTLLFPCISPWPRETLLSDVTNRVHVNRNYDIALLQYYSKYCSTVQVEESLSPLSGPAHEMAVPA